MKRDAATPGPDKPDDNADALTDPAYLDSLREQMLKFASLQLGDPHAAEDAVQEALVGALKNARSFAARSALKTWVFAILKNKIADLLRRRQRSPELQASQWLDDTEPEGLFDERGFWQSRGRLPAGGVLDHLRDLPGQYAAAPGPGLHDARVHRDELRGDLQHPAVDGQQPARHPAPGAATPARVPGRPLVREGDLRCSTATKSPG